MSTQTNKQQVQQPVPEQEQIVPEQTPVTQIMKAPVLRPNEIKLRPQSCWSQKNGTFARLIAYKDAQVTQNILDKMFGVTNWKCSFEYRNERLFCILSIWDNNKKEWIAKEDVGTPSKTQPTKGEVSDAFKRAATMVGIGRELYMLPDIDIELNANEFSIDKNGKPQLNSWIHFYVQELEYDEAEQRYTKFSIVDNNGRVRYQNGKRVAATAPAKTNTQAPMETMPENSNNEQNAPTVSAPPAENENMQNTKCSECGTNMKPEQIKFSMSRYKRPLCWNCQHKTK